MVGVYGGVGSQARFWSAAGAPRRFYARFRRARLHAERIGVTLNENSRSLTTAGGSFLLIRTTFFALTANLHFDYQFGGIRLWRLWWGRCRVPTSRSLETFFETEVHQPVIQSMPRSHWPPTTRGISAGTGELVLNTNSTARARCMWGGVRPITVPPICRAVAQH